MSVNDRDDDFEYVSIALPDDQLFLNYIMKRIVKRSLLKFNMQSGRVYEGFVIGLDDEWIQITTRDGLYPLPFQRTMVESIEDNRQIYTDADLGYTDEEKRKIVEYSTAVWLRASHELDEQKRERQRKKDKRVR